MPISLCLRGLSCPNYFAFLPPLNVSKFLLDSPMPIIAWNMTRDRYSSKKYSRNTVETITLAPIIFLYFYFAHLIIFQ